MIEPPSIDQRIVNQYSFFSVIPTGITDIEGLLAKVSVESVRYIIRKEIRWDIRDMLDQFNVNDRIIYPGLDGILWKKRKAAGAIPTAHQLIQVFAHRLGQILLPDLQDDGTVGLLDFAVDPIQCVLPVEDFLVSLYLQPDHSYGLVMGDSFLELEV